MKEYTFHMGGVDHDLETYKGIFFSWTVNAENQEEAVAISKRQLSESSDMNPLEVAPTPRMRKVHGMIVGVDPAAISEANIIEVWGGVA